MSRTPEHVGRQPEAPPGLSVLVVDDEEPALAELAWLLRQDRRVADVRTATSAAQALVALEAGGVDVVFSDIK
ncbi:MAG: response regulator, partial [Actinomycetes bacterium]